MNIWFKIFFRNAKKNWLNIIINITGLTLGLVGLILVLLYINDENSYNKWNPNKENIYRISNKSRDDGIHFVSSPGQFLHFKNDIPDVKDAIVLAPFYNSYNVSYEDKKVFSRKITVSESNFFDFFPFKILEGSIAKFKESRKHIALSKSLAIKIFNTEKATGKLLSIDNEYYTVSCIYKIPGKSNYSPDLVKQYSNPFEVVWNDWNYALYVKLNKKVNIAEVKQKMHQVNIKKNIKPFIATEGITLSQYEERYGFTEFLLEKLATIRLHHKANFIGPEGKGNYQQLLILLGLSVLLILISCVNFINLSTASASQRAKEVGVKKTLGLSKKVLIFQYISEIIIQCIIAFIIALVLVELILPTYNQFIDKNLSLTNYSLILKVAIITFLISVSIGSIPAIFMANFKITEVLKGNFSRSKKGVFVRNAMLFLQFLISGFFLIGVLVIYIQMDFMMKKDLGFSKEQTLVIQMGNIPDKYKKYELTKSILSKHKNIEEISASMFVPGDGYVNGTFIEYKEINLTVASNFVDYNYIDFAQLKILKGRKFSPQFTSDTITSVIINETCAKRLGIYNNPIGKKVDIGRIPEDDDRQMQVIGMIKDYHFDGFDSKIMPMFLIHWSTLPVAKQWIYGIQFKVKPKNFKTTITAIEEFWKENVDNQFSFEYIFLDKKFAQTYEIYQKQQRLFLIVSIVVILISLLGLFALATLTIQQRLKEVAIRKTLGASEKEIVVLLVKSFLKITLIASIILIPIAYYFIQNWLENFVYRIEMPIWPFIITPIILLLLVFSVVGIKAYNATKIDLIKYLKFE